MPGEIKLKPCPFCGSSDLICDTEIVGSNRVSVGFVECFGCHCYFRKGHTEYEVRNAWNRRAAESTEIHSCGST